MKAPTPRVIRKPRLLQRYLAVVARAITKMEKSGQITIFQSGDKVAVMEDDVMCHGVIVEAFPDDNPPLYLVDFPDGEDGIYDADDFC